MQKEKLYNIVTTIIVLTIITVTIIIILGNIHIPPKEEFDRLNQLTYDQCCDGKVCTDIYYSEEDNKCHSSFYYPVLYSWKVTVPLILGIATILLITSIIFRRRVKQEQLR